MALENVWQVQVQVQLSAKFFQFQILQACLDNTSFNDTISLMVSLV